MKNGSPGRRAGDIGQGCSEPPGRSTRDKPISAGTVALTIGILRPQPATGKTVISDALNRVKRKPWTWSQRGYSARTQFEILRLVNLGHSNREITDQLDITVGTTKWHLYQIFSKLYVKNRTAAAAKARQLGLL